VRFSDGGGVSGGVAGGNGSDGILSQPAPSNINRQVRKKLVPVKARLASFINFNSNIITLVEKRTPLPIFGGEEGS
jgi:hypothetical protein